MLTILSSEKAERTPVGKDIEKEPSQDSAPGRGLPPPDKQIEQIGKFRPGGDIPPGSVDGKDKPSKIPSDIEKPKQEMDIEPVSVETVGGSKNPSLEEKKKPTVGHKPIGLRLSGSPEAMNLFLDVLNNFLKGYGSVLINSFGQLEYTKYDVSMPKEVRTMFDLLNVINSCSEFTLVLVVNDTNLLFANPDEGIIERLSLS